jgi:hypothetical protein
MLPILELKAYTSSSYEPSLHEQPYCGFFMALVSPFSTYTLTTTRVQTRDEQDWGMVRLALILCRKLYSNKNARGLQINPVKDCAYFK